MGVGGTGGVVSKLMASLGWTTMPVCRFDDSEEGRLLRNGLAAYGCDMRYVTNLPDGGTTILSIVLTKRPDGSYKQRIFRRTFAIIDCIIAALDFLKL